MNDNDSIPLTEDDLVEMEKFVEDTGHLHATDALRLIATIRQLSDALTKIEDAIERRRDR